MYIVMMENKMREVVEIIIILMMLFIVIFN